MAQVIGFTAATLTALAFLPQVVKAWRSRSAEDLSMVMLLAQSTGVMLWIVYGISLRSMPMIVGNSVTLALTLLLLVFKRAYCVRKSGSVRLEADVKAGCLPRA